MPISLVEVTRLESQIQKQLQDKCVSAMQALEGDWARENREELIDGLRSHVRYRAYFAARLFTSSLATIASMAWVNVERPFAQVVSDTAVSVEGVIRLKHSRSTETDTFRFVLRPRQDALEFATSLRQDPVYRERDGLEVLGFQPDDSRRSASVKVEVPMHSPDYFEVRAKIESEFKSAMTDPLKTRDITVDRWMTRPLNRKRLGEAVAALTRRVIERGGTADLVRLEARQTSA